MVDKNRLRKDLTPNASWFDITLIEERDNRVDIILYNKKETLHLKIKKHFVRKQPIDIILVLKKMF